MKLICKLILLGVVLWSAGEEGKGDESKRKEVIKAKVERQKNWKQKKGWKGKLIVEGADLKTMREVMGALEGVFTRLEIFLGKGSQKNRILVRVENKPPERQRVYTRINGWLGERGKRLDFQLTIFPQSIEKDPEEFLRKAIEAFLYSKCFAKKKSFSLKNKAPNLPLWIKEGALQSFLKPKQKTWLKIATRALALGKAPSLEDVMGWEDLSQETIERGWQQAFSYIAWEMVMKSIKRRKIIKQWIRDFPQEEKQQGKKMKKRLRITEKEWVKSLDRVAQTSKGNVFSWDQTMTEWMGIRSMTVSDKNAKNVMTELDKLERLAQYAGIKKALRKKIEEILKLETFSDRSWRFVLATYREGLMALLRNPRSKYHQKLYIQKMKEGREAEIALRKRYDGVDDLLNWIEVNKKGPVQKTRFWNYFKFLEKIEKTSTEEKAGNSVDLFIYEEDSGEEFLTREALPEGDPY